MTPTNDPFSVFDYPFPILHLPATEGHTDQETGTWVPGENPTPAPITGHLQDITVHDLQRLPEGLYEIGDRRLTTPTRLQSGDSLEVTEPDGSSTRWIIKTLERFRPLFSRRHTYHLKKC